MFGATASHTFITCSLACHGTYIAAGLTSIRPMTHIHSLRCSSGASIDVGITGGGTAAAAKGFSGAEGSGFPPSGGFELDMVGDVVREVSVVVELKFEWPKC